MVRVGVKVRVEDINRVRVRVRVRVEDISAKTQVISESIHRTTHVISLASCLRSPTVPVLSKG